MGGAEQPQLEFGAVELEIEDRQGGQRLPPQHPGQVGGAGIGIGRLEGGEHGWAPQTHMDTWTAGRPRMTARGRWGAPDLVQLGSEG